MSATFSSLAFRNYRIWFAGALVANVGAWMQRVAQDWLVMTNLSDDSSFAVGIVTAMQFGPILLLSPVSGLLADRLDRQRLLLATQAAQALLAGGLGALVLLGHAQLWHVYCFAIALGAVNAIDNPARQVFVAQLVPPTKLSNAVGLNAASFNVARLIGPAASGLVIQVVGDGWVFIINAGLFALTIVAVAALRRRELYLAAPAPRAKGMIREGMRYISGRGDLILIFVVMGVISCFGLNFQLNSVSMARTVFDKDAGSFGLLSSIMAIGAVAGALLAARRERPRLRLVIGGAFGFAAATGLASVMPTYWTYALSGILIGFAANTLMTSANAAIQVSTDPQLRGRVMSVYLAIFQGVTLIGSPLVGWIAQAYGARWAVATGSITALAVGLWALWWARRRWRTTIQVHLRPHPGIAIVHHGLPENGIR